MEILFLTATSIPGDESGCFSITSASAAHKDKAEKEAEQDEKKDSFHDLWLAQVAASKILRNFYFSLKLLLVLLMPPPMVMVAAEHIAGVSEKVNVFHTHPTQNTHPPPSGTLDTLSRYGILAKIHSPKYLQHILHRDELGCCTGEYPTWKRTACCGKEILGGRHRSREGCRVEGSRVQDRCRGEGREAR